MLPERIETERLRLDRLTRDRLQPLEGYEVWGASRSPTIEEETRYTLFSPHETPNDTRQFLAESESAFDEAESAVYAVLPTTDDPGDADVTPRVDGLPVAGTAGVEFEWDRRRAELGIHLRKPFWGRGYSGERAAALCDLAFDRLDLDVVTVSHLPENEPSRRAIERYVERFGGRREGHLRNEVVDADGDVHDVVRYSIAADEWRAAVADDRPAVDYPDLEDEVDVAADD
jgi:RimJ/RimL family protein N-acetyltransferase